MKSQRESENNAEKLIPLTPSENAENSKVYNRFLNNAISDPNVYSIALTGDYGSGKSSLLHTFLKNEGKDYKVLKISLADFSFKSEKKEKSPQAVEIDLLQQIIFQTKDWDKNGPSPWIEKQSPNWRLFFVIVSIILSISSYFILFESESLVNLFFIEKYKDFEFEIIVNYISLLILIISFTWISFNTYNILKKIRLKRVHVKPLAIELGNEESRDSLINKYLMEIVKLFKHEKIDLVILEDIDRLSDHSLFLDLKKVNNVLRLNPDIDKKVTFIYAIRDSVFDDEKDKTKFFDLVIPVIPYVTSSNSKNKFLEIISEVIGGDLNDNLKDVISITSLRIDEMRTIINISNEFKVFRKIKGSKNIRDDKLLAIIIYKNLFPKDYELTASGSSSLHELFKSRGKRIEKIKIDKNKRIKHLESGVDESDFDEQVKIIAEIKELRDYVNKLNTIPFSEIFSFDRDFGELFFGLPYIEETDGEKFLEKENRIKRNILIPLISRNYISSDFMYYISLFHEGFVSKNDNEFLISVKDDIPLDFSFKLQNVEAVFKELSPIDWKAKAILNFDLFNYCFTSDKAQENIKTIYTEFADNVELGYNFVSRYFEEEEKKENVIHHVLLYWETFINDIVEKNYDIQNILPFVLINHYDLLSNQNINDSLTNLVNNTSEFVSLFDPYEWTQEELNHLQSNLIQFNVKLKDFTSGRNIAVFDTVYKSNAYKISVKNIETIFKHFEIKQPLSYTVLQCSKLESLKLYIEDGNLDLFIENVLDMCYAEYPTNRWKEDKESIIYLLNLDEDILSVSSKKKVIKKASSYKIDFSEIDDENLWELLCSPNKINSTWQNLLDYFKKIDYNEISEKSGILNLLNDATWVKEMDQLESESVTEYNKLITNILYCNFEKPTILKLFLNKLDFLLDDSNINENSDPVNIKNAIDGGFFEFTLEVYKKLKQVKLSDTLHLEYANRIQEIIITEEDNSLFQFSFSDIIFILTSDFKLDFKYFALLENTDSFKELTEDILISIYDIIIEKNDFTSQTLIESALNHLPLDYQIKLFNRVFENEEALDFRAKELLKCKFKGELKFVRDKLKNINLPWSEENNLFALNLKAMGLVRTYEPDFKEVSFKRNTKNLNDI